MRKKNEPYCETTFRLEMNLELLDGKLLIFRSRVLFK